LEGALAATTQPTSPTIINAAAVMVRTRNPMRGAKFIRDFLTTHPDQVDEAALNALGSALIQASTQEKALRFFRETANFYEAVNAKLEATRPGQKRWGKEWMTAAE